MADVVFVCVCVCVCHSVQCDAVEGERDGARKALALHGLLKMLIGEMRSLSHIQHTYTHAHTHTHASPSYDIA